MSTKYINGFEMSLNRKSRIGSYSVNFYNLGFRRGVDLSCKTKNISVAHHYHDRNISGIDYQNLPTNVKKAIKSYIIR